MEAEGEKAPGHQACLTGQVTPWRTCRFWLDVTLGLPRGPCLACGSQTGLYFPVTVYRGACSPVPFSRPRGERRPINQPIGFQTARPLAQLLRAAEGRWSWAPGPPPWGVPARCGRRPAGARPVSGTPCACCEQRAVAPSPPPPPQPKLVSGGCIVLLSCTEQTRACGWPQRSELGGDARTQPRQRGPGSEGRARGGWRSPLARSFSVLMSGLRLRAPVLWAPLGTRITALTWGPLEAHKVTLSAQPQRWGGPALEAWPLSLSAACALARGR